MLIGIDGNEANITTRVGVGQFAFNIIWQIYNLDKENKYIVYLKNSPMSDLPPETANWHYRIFGPKKFWTKFALPFNLYSHRDKLNLFFSPSHYSPQASPFPTIPTIHDLGYLDTPDQFRKKDIYQLTNWTKGSIKKANHIIAVSEFTKNEIQRIYHVDPRMITVANNGINPPPTSTPADDQKVMDKYGITKPYFLYLGTLKPNKNLPFLIKSFSGFLKLKISNLKFSLAIAGKKGWLFDDIFKVVTDLKLEKRVIFTDYVADADRFSLYRQATASVLPSVYEGFGIPALESMLVSTPVVVSNIPAFREVCDQAVLYINPKDQSTLISQLANVTHLKPEQRKQMIKLGLVQVTKFTWKNSAKTILEVFDKFRT